MLKQETPSLGALTGASCPPDTNAAALAGAAAPVEGGPRKSPGREASTTAEFGEACPAQVAWRARNSLARSMNIAIREAAR